MSPFDTAAMLRDKYRSRHPELAFLQGVRLVQSMQEVRMDVAAHQRLYQRAHRGFTRAKGDGAWANWHVSRGRMPLNPTPADLRRVSWRRPL